MGGGGGGEGWTGGDGRMGGRTDGRGRAGGRLYARTPRTDGRDAGRTDGREVGRDGRMDGRGGRAGWAKCEGLYYLFRFFGVFQFKNNGEIPSIWKHFGARLGDQKAKEYIVYFNVLSHKINFRENPKIKRDYKRRRILQPEMGGPWSGQKTSLPERTMIFLVAPKAPQLPPSRFTLSGRSDPPPLA